MTALLLIVVFLATALLMAATNHVGLSAWRKSRGEHWTQAARALYPIRVSRKLNDYAFPVLAVFAVRIVSPSTPWFGVAVAGFLGAQLGGYPMDKALFPGRDFKTWTRDTAAALVIQSLRWLAMVVAIFMMPKQVNAWTAIIPILWVAVHLSLLCGLNLVFLRALGLLKPASPRLLELIKRANRDLHAPMRAAWEFEMPLANALALPITQEVIVSIPLLREAPDDELLAVCAHELGHLTESRWVTATRVAGALAYLPFLFVLPVWNRFSAPGAIAIAFISLAISHAVKRISRAMEKRADRLAVENTGDNVSYARALERIYRINQMPAVLPKRASATHPNLYDRMIAADVTPEYARPAAPSTQHWSSVVTVFVAGLLGLFAFSP